MRTRRAFDTIMTCSKPILCFTAGVMDMLHEGHLNVLAQMKLRGDVTAVVLHDGFTTFKNKSKLPVEPIEKRVRNLIDCGLVDIIRITYEEEPVKEFQGIINRYKNLFNLIFMRGDDWKDFPGRNIIEASGIPIEFISYTKGISSSLLREVLREAI